MRRQRFRKMLPFCKVSGEYEMELPQRKHNRLTNFDYSTPGAYFITICTKDRKSLFWENVGASIARPQDVVLTECGKITEMAIRNITVHYPAVTVDNFVIMPNHIHLLLRITSDVDGRPMVAPTISTVVQQMKGYVTKQTRTSVWQKLFHDHVIRGDADYQRIWNYIDGNPMKWAEDCFYTE